MEQSILIRTGVLLSMVVLVFGTSLLPAFAHDDEETEATHTESTKPVSAKEIKRMETLIDLLEQLITMMNALKIQQGYAPVAHVVAAPKADVVEDHHDESEMDEHHEEHSTEATSTVAVKQLLIEVEPHNEKTHVHVRYVDKQEAMFFVNSDIHDTAAIVNEVITKTGLTKEEIEKALKFME